MITTVRYIAQTLTRLCVDPIDTSLDFVVKFLFNWRRDDDADADATNNGNKSGGGRFHPWRRWRGRRRTRYVDT